MSIKQKCEIEIRKVLNKKRQVELAKVDKKMCIQHPEWIDLTKDEQKRVSWWEIYAHKCYKNIFGGGYSEGFVSDALYQTKILPKLNVVNYTKTGQFHRDSLFADKNYQDVFMNKFMYPDIVIRNIEGEFYDRYFNHICKEKAISICRDYPKLVFKKSIETGHGRGVGVVNEKDYATSLNVLEKNYIVQEIMKQHKSLEYYNASSVNIIRITSLFWKGKVYILGGILRVGTPGSFCDLISKDGQYPLVIPIDGEGKLCEKAIDCDNGYVYKDVRGKKIAGSILHYSEMKESIKSEHIKYPYHKIIGWDLSLDEAGNIRCMEYNSGCPGIVQSQFALGPIFAIRMESGNNLLDEILCENNN